MAGPKAPDDWQGGIECSELQAICGNLTDDGIIEYRITKMKNEREIGINVQVCKLKANR